MFTNARQRTSGRLIWALVATFTIPTAISFTAPPVVATRKLSEHHKIHPLFRRITWMPPAVSTTIAPGQSQTFSLSLTVPRPFRDVGVHVSRGLRPFVHVEPLMVERIGVDQTVKITLTIFVPQTAVRGRVEGKLRLFRRLGFGRKGKTIAIPLLLARPLPVVIDIERTAPVVTIIEPSDGTIVSEGSVLVRGTVEADASEIGVTVNDVIAAVQGNSFAAFVHVTPEVTNLTAVATTASEATGSATIGLTVTPATDPDFILRLQPSPPGGVAPLSVAFSLLGGSVPTVIDLDLEGQGAVDFSGPTLDGQAFTYDHPGIYFPTVMVTDADGNQFSASAIIQIYEQDALDALLQNRWTNIKDSLRTGDVPRAVTFIHSEARATYQAQLSRISLAALATIDQYMTPIQLIEVGPGGAQYEMLRDRNGQTLSFAVWFRRDQDGLWRLRRF
jgi:hypothetical protein